MHSAIYTDGIRRAPTNRTVNVVRADCTPDQVRAGTGREFSSGNGGTCIRQHHRAADVA
jgi:hypothetical protein